jgi:UDPglucose 6-dehydrogenase
MLQCGIDFPVIAPSRREATMRACASLTAGAGRINASVSDGTMKIAVFGLGYVGLSNAALLAQHNHVMAVDVNADRVALLNDRKSPIVDAELEEFLATRELDLTATLDAQAALADADYVIVATPTNYDVDTNKFDTSSVEAVIAATIAANPQATIVIKSTIPVGFVDDARAVQDRPGDLQP